jgi:mannose-1-phosphate guanylyltransferase
MRAMILAAGLGTRLRPLTDLMPKPLAPVLNKPVMEHIVELLAANGFTEVIANLSWLPEQIRDHFGDGGAFGVELTYSDEPEPLGTAGGVYKACEYLTGGEEDSFLVISGDALTDIDLQALRSAHERAGGIATLATKRVEDTSQFGVVISGDDGRIQGFQEKPDPAEALSDLANCGIYMFRSEIFDHFPGPGHRSPAGDEDQPEGFVDWAQDVFPSLLDSDVPFHAHDVGETYWNDVGSVGEYVQGNFDALEGRVNLTPGEGAIRDGEMGRVMVGSGVEVGADAELRGPVVLGEGCRVGAGARLRECVVLADAEIPARIVMVGGVLG